MPHILISFKIKADKGCLVLSDTEDFGEISDWDPEEEAWFRSGNSFIFSVAPSIEGAVEIEIWNRTPRKTLPGELFSRQVVTGVELMEVFDPGGRAAVRFPSPRGSFSVYAFANRPESPDKLQIAIEKS